MHSFNVPARVREIRESFRALKEVSSEEEIGKAQDLKAATGLVLQKLGVALAVSEGAAYLGAPVISSLAQLITKNPQTAITTMAVMGYVIAIAAFDASWYSANRAYYKDVGANFKERAGAFIKDVLPLHAVACSMAIPFTVFSNYLAGNLSRFIGVVTHGMDVYIPSFAYSFAIFACCEALPYIAMMTPVLQKVAEKFAPKYLSFLKKKEGAAPLNPAAPNLVPQA